MTKREFQKNLIKEGTPPKLARMLAGAVEEIFRLAKKAAKLECDGKHEDAQKVADEIVRWLKGMNAFVESVAGTLTEENEA